MLVFLLLVLVLVLVRVLVVLRGHLLLRDMVLLQCLMLVRMSRAIITRPLATSRCHAPVSAVCAPGKINYILFHVGAHSYCTWRLKCENVRRTRLLLRRATYPHPRVQRTSPTTVGCKYISDNMLGPTTVSCLSHVTAFV